MPELGPPRPSPPPGDAPDGDDDDDDDVDARGDDAHVAPSDDDDADVAPSLADDDEAEAEDVPPGAEGDRGRPHRSVLPAEVVAALAPPTARDSDGWWLDGTVGAGGHSALLLDALPRGHLIGLDRDPSALELARARLAPFGERAVLVRSAFADALAVLDARAIGGLLREAQGSSSEGVSERSRAATPSIPALRGALLDLGVSSMQLDQAERGFSFTRGGPLDMRMDPQGPVTARDLVHGLPEDQLADVIYRLGEDRLSRRIARAIVRARETAPLATTADLADVVRRAVPPPPPGARRIHPATRTFQALRMAVNDELGQLERALPDLFSRLAPGGRLAVISFHSLEDRAVKTFARARQADGTGLPLTRKPIVASAAEVAGNPRARSAKLRVIERVVPVAAASPDGPQPWRRKKPRRA